jgi:hypothetical protein
VLLHGRVKRIVIAMISRLLDSGLFISIGTVLVTVSTFLVFGRVGMLSLLFIILCGVIYSLIGLHRALCEHIKVLEDKKKR